MTLAVYSKKLKIAVQMDDIAAIKIRTDTSFALSLEAQNRGYEVYYYTPDKLSMKNSKLVLTAQRVTLKDDEKDYYSLDKTEHVDPLDLDVILMRQDPPFDMNYLTYTYFLEMICDKVMVINHPAHVRNCPEKIFACKFAEFMPPTLISANKQEIAEFYKEYKDVVVKPLYAFGGMDVFRANEKSGDVSEIADSLLKQHLSPVIIQKYLPGITKGDKRIMLIDGKIAGALNRIPKEGEVRSNMAQGGTPVKTEITEREQQICDVLGEELRKRDLILAGIDVIDGYLTEINITSPTGMRVIDRLNGSYLPALFWDVVEGKLNAQNN